MKGGRRFDTVEIAAGLLSARVMTYGASLRDLRLSGHPSPLVLGFPRDEDYLKHSVFHGAICGRFANRIGRGRFVIDGERYQADRNGEGGHTLHGGEAGLWSRVWELHESGPDFVTLAIRDPHGANGFPGTLDITCTWRILPPATLSVELVATTDRPTLCSLAAHPYFNLDDGGAGHIGNHRLMVEAAAYLPVDPDGLPTGAVVPVAGTAFDFVVPRTIGLEWEAETFAFDNNFCLAPHPTELRRAAWVQGARSGVEMELWTTEPGLQFFDGNLPPRTVPGLDGIVYGARAGLCLEPQGWPDSPNRRYFPQAILRPGEAYRQVTQYRFRLSDTHEP
jgi:aldose 1-epimerase